MTDTKGGFLSTDDDPHSILSADNLRDKPAGMSLQEWSRHQLRVKMQKEKQGFFEPMLSALDMPDEEKRCWECGSPEIDWKWKEIFGCRVCEKCKRAKEEKYSLLTKTECREDYMLTEREFITGTYVLSNRLILLQRNSRIKTSCPTWSSPTRTNPPGLT